AGQEVDHDRHDDDQQDDVADPPDGHEGLLSATMAAFAAMPGSAPRIVSNWALIALTDGSSVRRCSDSTISSAPASVASVSEVECRRRRTSISAAASTATTTTASRMLRTTSVEVLIARTPVRGRRSRRASNGALSCRHPPVAVGQGVHVPVLDDGLLDDEPEDGRRRLERRDVRGVARDLAGDLQQASRRPVDAHDGADEEDEEDGDDQRGDEADDQRDRPQVVVRDGEGDAHLPTATFRSARAACRIRTPESLIRSIPSSATVCLRTTSTPSTAPLACPAIRRASATIVITIAAATSTTTTPRTSPTGQPADAPITVMSHLLHPSK